MGDNLGFVDLGDEASPEKIVSGRHHNCVLFNNFRIKCFGRGVEGTDWIRK